MKFWLNASDSDFSESGQSAIFAQIIHLGKLDVFFGISKN